MCGRFVQITPGAALARLLGLRDEPGREPTYNLAPTQDVMCGRILEGGEVETPLLRWGLIPSWAKDISVGARMINARAETVREKPSFRSAFKSRRCLIPTEGFYEWYRQGKQKRPHFLHHQQEGQPLLFAGLWERWSKGEEPLETCSILTCAANERIEPLHHRMPVILHEKAALDWLDPAADLDQVAGLMRPASADMISIREVSTLVNNARNDDPLCMEPLENTGGLFPAGPG